MSHRILKSTSSRAFGLLPAFAAFGALATPINAADSHTGCTFDEGSLSITCSADEDQPLIQDDDPLNALTVDEGVTVSNGIVLDIVGGPVVNNGTITDQPEPALILTGPVEGDVTNNGTVQGPGGILVVNPNSVEQLGGLLEGLDFDLGPLGQPNQIEQVQTKPPMKLMAEPKPNGGDGYFEPAVMMPQITSDDNEDGFDGPEDDELSTEPFDITIVNNGTIRGSAPSSDERRPRKGMRDLDRDIEPKKPTDGKMLNDSLVAWGNDSLTIEDGWDEHDGPEPDDWPVDTKITMMDKKLEPPKKMGGRGPGAIAQSEQSIAEQLLSPGPGILSVGAVNLTVENKSEGLIEGPTGIVALDLTGLIPNRVAIEDDAGMQGEQAADPARSKVTIVNDGIIRGGTGSPQEREAPPSKDMKNGGGKKEVSASLTLDDSGKNSKDGAENWDSDKGPGQPMVPTMTEPGYISMMVTPVAEPKPPTMEPNIKIGKDGPKMRLDGPGRDGPGRRGPRQASIFTGGPAYLAVGAINTDITNNGTIEGPTGIVLVNPDGLLGAPEIGDIRGFPGIGGPSEIITDLDFIPMGISPIEMAEDVGPTPEPEKIYAESIVINNGIIRGGVTPLVEEPTEEPDSPDAQYLGEQDAKNGNGPKDDGKKSAKNTENWLDDTDEQKKQPTEKVTASIDGGKNGKPFMGKEPREPEFDFPTIGDLLPPGAAYVSIGNVIDTLTNNGTIEGNGETPTILLGLGDDTLTVNTGSTITGVSDGEEGMDTLRLGGLGPDVFDLSEIIDPMQALDTTEDQFAGFESFQVDSGTWTFSGTTTQTFNVNGGTVMGTGTFGSLDLAGGTLAPGNSIGTINVTNDLTFQSGSTFQVEVNPAGQSDLVNVGGTATIEQGVTLDILGEAGIYMIPSPTYTIIDTTGGVTGTFDTVQDNVPDVDFTAVYTGTEVQLTYAAIATPPAAPNTPPPDQSERDVQSAGTIAAGSSGNTFNTTAFGNRNPAGGGSNTDNTTRNRLSFQDLDGNFLSEDDLQGPGLSFADQQRANGILLWGEVSGHRMDVDAQGAQLSWDASSVGLAFGADFALQNSPVILTVAAGYTETDTSVGLSTSDIETTHIGVGAKYQSGPLTLNAGLSYGWQDYDNARGILVGTNLVTANSSTSGTVLAATLGAYYDLASDREGISFGPLVNVDWTRAESSAYTETGAGILNQAVNRTTAELTTTRLGIAGSRTISTGSGSVTLDGLLAWENISGDRSVFSSSTLIATGTQFATTSAPIDSDRVVVGLGALFSIGSSTQAFARYEGAFGENSQEHLGTIGFTWSF